MRSTIHGMHTAYYFLSKKIVVCHSEQNTLCYENVGYECKSKDEIRIVYLGDNQISIS